MKVQKEHVRFHWDFILGESGSEEIISGSCDGISQSDVASRLHRLYPDRIVVDIKKVGLATKGGERSPLFESMYPGEEQHLDRPLMAPKMGGKKEKSKKSKDKKEDTNFWYLPDELFDIPQLED
jgi:hypothetical protein